MINQADVIIIGAGWSGLMAGKFCSIHLKHASTVGRK